jgi:hypothetical protein
MPWAPRYATLYHLRARGVSATTLPDDDARELIDDLSRWVEDYTDQIFYPHYAAVDLDGEAHRLLRHPSLWPILSTPPTVAETVERTRESYSTYTTSSSIYQLAAADFGVETKKVPRNIVHYQGAWNEGSKNYLVTSYWGWLDRIAETDFVLASGFDGTSDQLELTSVAGLRVHDMGTLPDYTVLTIVDIDTATNIVTVDGGDLITTAAVAADAFIRWGCVPMGVRKFVLEMAYLNSGATDDEGDGGWLKRERTDTYEWERFSPIDMGMQGGEMWTGIPMIDSGLRRYCRPAYIGFI